MKIEFGLVFNFNFLDFLRTTWWRWIWVAVSCWVNSRCAFSWGWRWCVKNIKRGQTIIKYVFLINLMIKKVFQWWETLSPTHPKCHLSNKFDLMSYKNRSKYWFTKTEIISLVLSRYKFLFGDISNLIKSKAFKIAFNFSFLTWSYVEISKRVTVNTYSDQDSNLN